MFRNDFFTGMQPLHGHQGDGWEEDIAMNKMRKQCIGAKLIRLSDSSWGNCSFNEMEFDNGYVVIPDGNNGTVYDNKHKMQFYLYRIIRLDGYELYFIHEQNANKYLKISKLEEEDRRFPNFKNAKVEKCNLSLTPYQMKNMQILDNHFNEATENWVDYLKITRADPEKYSRDIDY